MNKWLILFAVVLVTFGFAFTIPITLRNPSWTNLGISLIMFLIMIAGLRSFYKAGKPQKQIINNQEVVPVD